ncbi:hypothetical protein PFICI_13226 [Pestalotiopsis fici W106-1]|uniref:chitinase n=1 Tax=Pestalotiopsis fici (strain W106-1 / CGMCC3.15140) TaxID=1229662 RepID=W3WNQ6_PESFW|nr:uncharacterized protein PFICI_13226 [Pestalotiopsis fici W106-1]ETS74742.1 hypothetical protein PFICI_13226 [Pestalotiopsis fici W106-1]
MLGFTLLLLASVRLIHSAAIAAVKSLPECGQHAATPNATCPLNVCCSQYGFCGTTPEFCGQGCQFACEQPKPHGAESNSQKRVIGYWEAFNSNQPCGMMPIESIPASLLTHLNVAFAYITPDYQMTNMAGVAENIYSDLANVKSRNPRMKIIISVGGYGFNDPGPTQTLFSDMVGNAKSRATFISSILTWLAQKGFDGIDFDWEYPTAQERGGRQGDGANFTQFLKEFREAIHDSGKDYIVTFTAPVSYWYLRGFDLEQMMTYVDWVNVMSYDLHGTWDQQDQSSISGQVLAHTNLTEIDSALNLFWRNNVDPAKVALGLGLYGRTYTLSDPSCYHPGCATTTPGKAGPCTAQDGILSYREIMQVISDTGASPHTDEAARVEYMVYNDNQWVSYDSPRTFKSKIEYANKLGLSGLMLMARYRIPPLIVRLERFYTE